MLDELIVRSFPGLVVRKVDEYQLVINRGYSDGVEKGDLFMVYYVEPEELIDPETNESLGKLEVVRGTGKAVHVQEKITTIKSNMMENISGKTIRRSSSPFAAIGVGTETIEQPTKELLPFDSPDVGDKVKKY